MPLWRNCGSLQERNHYPCSKIYSEQYDKASITDQSRTTNHRPDIMAEPPNIPTSASSSSNFGTSTSPFSTSSSPSPSRSPSSPPPQPSTLPTSSQIPPPPANPSTHSSAPVDPSPASAPVPTLIPIPSCPSVTPPHFDRVPCPFALLLVCPGTGYGLRGWRCWMWP